MSQNRVILIGNLGNDPEVKSVTTDNVKVAKLSLATEDGTKEMPKTNWHSVVLWKERAEFAEKYLHKGSKVFVEGYLNYRSYTDKDNNTRYTTEVVCQRIEMLDRRQDQGGQQTSQQSEQTYTEKKVVNNNQAPAGAENDLPF